MEELQDVLEFNLHLHGDKPLTTSALLKLVKAASKVKREREKEKENKQDEEQSLLFPYRWH